MSESVLPKTFEQLGLHPLLLNALKQSGYERPTPIQEQAIPAVISGSDVMGAAQTGTGKTAAFTLPILHRLMPLASHSTSPARHPVRALVLTPTRELAVQIAENVTRYSSHTPLKTVVVYGGVDMNVQKAQLRAGCELVIATPGRLLDHVEQKNIQLGQVSMFVLDEADRMLDMGFLTDLERIIRLLPAQRQNLLFSATFSTEIRKLARSYQQNPVEISVAAHNATADTVTQVAYRMNDDDKPLAIMYLVMSKGLKQVIVFTNTKLGASKLARTLTKLGVNSDSIHGDKSQQERIKTLDSFKAGRLDVLVATDVAARGLDIAGVPCVINYDLPFSAEDYVHRIGRTGRAGASGEAIALVSGHDERLLADIEKLVKRTMTLQELAIPSSYQNLYKQSSQTNRYGKTYHKETIDPFFLKPYQPKLESGSHTGGTQQAASLVTGSSLTSKKKSLAVLLGGGKKAS